MGTAGAFKTVEEAQYKICPEHAVFTPETRAESVYHTLYALY
jgi:L-ribulokinase